MLEAKVYENFDQSFEWIKSDARNLLKGGNNDEFLEIIQNAQYLGLDFSPILSELFFLEIENFTQKCLGLNECLEWFAQILPCLELIFKEPSNY